MNDETWTFLRRNLGRDVASLIDNHVNQMHFDEWKQRVDRVHRELDITMYCVYWTTLNSRWSDTPEVLAQAWNGGYHLERLSRRESKLRLLVCAMNHEDITCLECHSRW